MARTRDPFRVLGLSYDADVDAVRRAFRRLARQTHPDRGGSADTFHEVRVAYGALLDDLDGARRRWRTPPAPPASRPRYPAGLHPRTFPTCPVRISRTRDGRQVVEFKADQRPRGWRPGADSPPGGTCEARFAATDAAPAFGVWVVPLDPPCVRYVFGPHPASA